MKELTIKDKAKRYDEALKKIQKYVKDDYGCTRLRPEDIFPELAESEDEDIKQFLIDFIKVCGWTEKNDQGWPSKEKCITWLEKQGEQKSIWHNEDEEPQRDSLILLVMQSGTPIVAKIIEPNHTFNHGERWAYIDDLLEKQVEPTDIPDDAVLDSNKDGLIADTIRCKTEKQEWSEEDEKHIHSIISTIECNRETYKQSKVITDSYTSDLEWFKSLINRCKLSDDFPRWKKLQKI